MQYNCVAAYNGMGYSCSQNPPKPTESIRFFVPIYVFRENL